MSFRETLSAIGCLFEINQRLLVQVVERLPTYLQHRWKSQASKLHDMAANPSIHDLVQFVQSAVREVSDPVHGSLGISSRAKKADPPQAVKKKRVSMVPQLHKHSRNRKRCVACDSPDSPSLFKCKAFKKLTPENRFEIAKHNYLCYNCLKGGHGSADCKTDSTCAAKGCRMKHTKFLHVTCG